MMIMMIIMMIMMIMMTLVMMMAMMMMMMMGCRGMLSVATGACEHTLVLILLVRNKISVKPFSTTVREAVRRP